MHDHYFQVKTVYHKTWSLWNTTQNLNTDPLFHVKQYSRIFWVRQRNLSWRCFTWNIAFYRYFRIFILWIYYKSEAAWSEHCHEALILVHDYLLCLLWKSFIYFECFTWNIII